MVAGYKDMAQRVLRKRWFKFYVDEVFGKFADFDVDVLQPDERWGWIALRTICTICKFQPMLCISPQVGFSDEQLAKTMKISLDLWTRTKQKLIDFGRILVDEYNIITILDWNYFECNTYKFKRHRKDLDIVPIITSADHVMRKLPSKEQEDRARVTKLVKQVIELLNESAGKRYRFKGSAHRRFISGRISEGATLDDFRFVIEQKSREWVSNPEMEKYLRPSTLFNATKFWEYRNERPVSPSKHGTGMPRNWLAPKEYKEEYDKVIDGLKARYGWKKEEDIDYFLAPTFSEFCRMKRIKDRKPKEENDFQVEEK